MDTALAAIALLFAGVPAVLFLYNLTLYKRPRPSDGKLPAVSVLIPARNEERTIGAARGFGTKQYRRCCWRFWYSMTAPPTALRSWLKQSAQSIRVSFSSMEIRFLRAGAANSMLAHCWLARPRIRCSALWTRTYS